MAAKKKKTPANTTSKTGSQPRSPARSTAARAPTRKAAAAPPQGLSSADEALLASYPPEFDRLPDQSVPRILTMAREVLAAGKQAITALAAHTRVGKADLERLEADAALLARCEDIWGRARDVRVDSKDIAEGEALKSDALAALDYWLEADAEVAARVSKVREGTGIADLADDLEKLADLLDENAAALKKADLAKGAAARMRALAESLASGLAGRRSDVSSRALLTKRNLAFYGLVAKMDAVCAAGRYAFRKEPRKAKLFASVATRKRVQRKSRAPKKTGPATPDA
ncbi:MAG: hypothetical protein IPQ09_25830 [Myxococcales bacterium]|nr:hypothetical protein [Myxococcales bacterium]